MNKIKSLLSNWKVIAIVVVLVGVIIGGDFLYQKYLSSKNKNTSNTTKSTSTKCERDKPYQNSPEFNRAISLIIQRHEEYLDQRNYIPKGLETDVGSIPFEESSTFLYWRTLKQYQNCISVEYMSNEEENLDAEAYFSFDSTSTPQKLEIKVSKKYQSEDDLLTAVLLSHELHHATSYVLGYPPIAPMTEERCYTTERTAFVRQLLFLKMLNYEEKNSIQLRLNNLSSSGIKDLNNLLLITHGKSAEEIKEMIKNDPYYQEECKI